jgi:hypothetical protein
MTPSFRYLLLILVAVGLAAADPASAAPPAKPTFLSPAAVAALPDATSPLKVAKTITEMLHASQFDALKALASPDIAASADSEKKDLDAYLTRTRWRYFRDERTVVGFAIGPKSTDTTVNIKVELGSALKSITLVKVDGAWRFTDL